MRAVNCASRKKEAMADIRRYFCHIRLLRGDGEIHPGKRSGGCPDRPQSAALCKENFWQYYHFFFIAARAAQKNCTPSALFQAARCPSEQRFSRQCVEIVCPVQFPVHAESVGIAFEVEPEAEREAVEPPRFVGVFLEGFLLRTQSVKRSLPPSPRFRRTRRDSTRSEATQCATQRCCVR